jgi:hypothetical protein
MKMKQATSPKDVPVGPHYALLLYKQKTVHHEGDLRSRTDPGHGYPESDETFNVVEHFVTADRVDWENDIRQLTLEKAKSAFWTAEFVAFEVKGVAEVKMEISITGAPAKTTR